MRKSASKSYLTYICCFESSLLFQNFTSVYLIPDRFLSYIHFQGIYTLQGPKYLFYFYTSHLFSTPYQTEVTTLPLFAKHMVQCLVFTGSLLDPIYQCSPQFPVLFLSFCGSFLQSANSTHAEILLTYTKIIVQTFGNQWLLRGPYGNLRESS